MYLIICQKKTSEKLEKSEMASFQLEGYLIRRKIRAQNFYFLLGILMKNGYKTTKLSKKND